MKKFNMRMFLIAVIFALSACSSNAVKEPKEIGRQVFAMLKKLKSSSKEDYIANFISIEEIRKLGENEKLVKNADMRNEMTSMSKEKWTRNLEGDYNRTKEKGLALGINWGKIQYSDFIYELIEKDGLKGSEGKLYFKANEKLFAIETASIFNGKAYQLVEVKWLRQQK